MSIPVNKPFVDDRVLDYIKTVLDSGKLSGDGPMGKAVEAQLCELFSITHVLLTTSCTHALEMAMMMLDLQPDDEVITPSFTFVSTANAILHGGGKPVFCEINDRTLTIDVKDFERRITSKTRAVVVVHYAGVSAEMDEVMAIARARNMVVVEDAAQGVNAKYKGKFLGTIGDCGAYSFHDTKNYVCGEGGAFLTDEETLARKGEIIREKGTNRANFLRGQVDKYTWVDLGSSYILSDLLAAVLKCQLDDLDVIQERRRRIYEMYMMGLRDLEQHEKLRLPIIPEYCESNYHIFYILLRSEVERNTVMKKLKEFGIQTTFHYVPLHSSPFALQALGTKDVSLPVTDRISQNLLRLPIYPQIETAEVEYVIEKLHECLK
ncbi:MAG: dTDP-4-amino-4,6-dideoxygalactose transaminase [Ignavibacteriae bacterium]|nr:dTDP-4-amino-4,6-dideoxygalactose transaminase [Ignavibacteria bacterium]MBI3363548.1 dTDP-4-amino-4,6-dideoxygalactose transaminase [Ignavibacteriota bacterium]